MNADLNLFQHANIILYPADLGGEGNKVEGVGEGGNGALVNNLLRKCTPLHEHGQAVMLHIVGSDLAMLLGLFWI